MIMNRLVAYFFVLAMASRSRIKMTGLTTEKIKQATKMFGCFFSSFSNTPLIAGSLDELVFDHEVLNIVWKNI